MTDMTVLQAGILHIALIASIAKQESSIPMKEWLIVHSAGQEITMLTLHLYHPLTLLIVQLELTM